MLHRTDLAQEKLWHGWFKEGGVEKMRGGKSEMKCSLPSIPGKTGTETEGKGSVGNEATLGTRHLRLNYF